MTLHVCAIASRAQETRANRLEQLQAESKRLQFDQSAKLDVIVTALGELRQRVNQIQGQNRKLPPPVEDIESLGLQISELSLSQEAIAEEQALLQSLSFKCRPERHSKIPKAHQQTFGWTFEPGGLAPVSATYIAEWLKSDAGLFWVSGKPGSGKSTFMKFMAEEPRTYRFLSHWSGPERLVIASHYFWSAGTSMQKSQNGLLRSLLYDIFRQQSELITPICGDRRPGPGAESESGFLPWTNSDLQMILRRIAANTAASVRFCFFIDGLGEYDSEYEELCQILMDIAQSPKIKICVSSRPWNVFEDAFGDSPRSKLYIQDLTRNDILAYIRCSLQEHRRWPLLAKSVSQADWLIEEIEKRAQGVFLWVYLVVKLLREGLTNRDSFSDIRRRLESFPRELEVFFRQILESVERFYWNKMSTMMQMAIAAKEPLHAMAYDFHDQDYDDEDYVFRVPIRPYSLEEDQESREQLVWRLNSCTRGLLEMNPQSGIVTFLHRTVMDFLKTREMSDFLDFKAPPGFNLSLCLLKVYTAMVKRHELEEPVVRKHFGAYNDCYLQFLTINALACATEVYDTCPSNASRNEILADLDNAVMVRYSEGQINFINGHQAKCFVREQLIQRQDVEFLTWKLPRDPKYLSGLDPSLIPHILPDGGHRELRMQAPWRPRGIEILRLVLETQELGLNETKWNANPRLAWTPWTALLGHTTSWSRETSGMIEERFWSLLENNILALLLRGGADPMVMLWRSQVESWPAFAAYLNLAFEISCDTARETLYIEVLKEFLKAGASLEVPLFMVESMQLGGGVRIINPGQKFLERLKNIPVVGVSVCNIRLLAQVVDMLLSAFGDSKATWLRRSIAMASKTVFPGDIYERLKIRYPALSWP
ncbi:hypothetical protein DL767_011485 [Monosporascus sp. MG133]|nr:hypothetical protein DL767_011485 [Monosporascus sp. MG133]